MNLPTTPNPVSRVTQQIKNSTMLALYQTWRYERANLTLPILESLNLAKSGLLEQVFVSEVVDLAPFTLRTTHLGFALRTQLGRNLDDGDVLTADSEDILGGMEATYRRCVRLQEPSYESMRFKLEDGKPLTFERLLLPCASADGSAYYLVGMVVFENLALSSPMPELPDPHPSFDTPKLAQAVEQLAPDAIDRLPFGAIKLDRSGAVMLISQRERELSGRGDRPSLGLDFFTDIAPCMDNPHFKGRIDAALAAGLLDAEFSHVGDFADRDRELSVRAEGMLARSMSR